MRKSHLFNLRKVGYNFSPASIFLGDSGSMFLGFMLAAVAVSTDTKGTALTAIAVPMLAVGVPLLDATLAIWRRTVRKALGGRNGDAPAAAGGGVFRADTDHVHHRLLAAGLSPRGVAICLYALGGILVTVGLLSAVFQYRAHGIYILAFVAGSYVVVRHLASVELWDSGAAIVDGLRKPPSKVLSVLMYPPLDVILLGVALAAAIFFASPSLPLGQFRRFWFDRIPLWVGIPFLSLFFSKAYTRVWSRARVSEFVMLGIWLVAGVLVAAGVSVVSGDFEAPVRMIVVDTGTFGDMTIVMGQPVPRALALHVLIYAALSLALLVGLRALPRAVQDAMVWADWRRPGADRSPAVAIYGAGRGCSLFLIEQSLAGGRGHGGFRIAALYDDDTNLHGRLVHGYKVAGGADLLLAAVRRGDVSRVVLTIEPPPPVQAALCDAARAAGVTLSRWRAALTPLS